MKRLPIHTFGLLSIVALALTVLWPIGSAHSFDQARSKAFVHRQDVLTLAGARAVAAAAEATARDKRARVVIAVVDPAGIPILVERLDGTQVASVNVAMDKARTAAIYRRPSRDFEQQVTDGRVSAMALSGAVALQGGIPIFHRGEVIGAIGVSGETPAIDEAIAIEGANAIKKR